MYTIIAVFSFITLLFIAREETFAEALDYNEGSLLRIMRAVVAGLPLAAMVHPAAQDADARLFALTLFTAATFASAIYETHKITDFGYNSFVAAQAYGDESCPNPEELSLPLFCLEQPLERYLKTNGWSKKK